MIKNKHYKIKQLKKIVIFSLLSSSLAMLLGCQPTASMQKEPITKQGLYFDTLISVSIYDSTDNVILDDCFNLCDKYEHMFSPKLSESDIYHINSSYGKQVSINNETASLIKDAAYYSELTDGMFDITVYAVSSLWDFHNPGGSIPDKNIIIEKVQHVDYKKVNISDNNILYLEDPQIQLELGGIAKGYIADMIAEHLEKCNVKSAIVNIGGDIRVIGKKPDNTPFAIGIKDPSSPDDVMAAICADNISVATSGTYERYIEYNGARYHHILDPLTGYPVKSDVTSVTVLTDSSERADALCTCVILCGSKEGIELIESQKNTEAIMKLTDGSIIKSSGIDKYLMLSQ